MVVIIPQASFNAGEWSPNLNARVDLAKYKSGAALLENFFVDYRGGASTRPGTKYILQARDSTHPVRMISFQASFNIGYALEFGQNYIRFYYQGAPVLETPVAVTGVNLTNPVGVHISAGWAAGDVVFFTGVGGTTQLDGNYYTVIANAAGVVTLADLNGTAIDGTGFTAWTAGGTGARVYTLASPYAGADLALVKFAQVTNQMILCHPNYVPYQLSLIAATNWTLAAITFGSTASAPTGITAVTTLGGGSVAYSYVVTTIDGSGQESAPSAAVTLVNHADIRTTAGTIKLTWSPVPGAQGYNVYESYVSYFGILPSGVNYGFTGTCSGTTFIDSNITPDFSESPPVTQTPFSGSGVAFITISAGGAYTSVPTATATGGSPSIPAVLSPTLGLNAVPTITSGGAGYVVGELVNFGNGVIMQVTTVATGVITAWATVNGGTINSGATPANPVAQVTTSGAGTGATATCTWGVGAVTVINPGAGYGSVPTLTFGSGAAAGTITLGATSNGNPSVPAFCQQRLVLAGQPGAPQTFHMSQPGAYYNFNVTAPVVASNAITETLVSSKQENIKSIVTSTAGMLVLTDAGVWLLNGGASGTAIGATTIVANRQSTVGASDVPPIVANYSVLFPQSKGNAVRDLTYNIYFNTFTGADISLLASHLFYGYTVKEWAWAESPFYLVWTVRNDGVLLSLTFLKDQEFTAWTHHVTQGTFQSVCVVIEVTSYAGIVDAPYLAVSRTINGRSVTYIERMADRVFPFGASSAWSVDAGIQYTGAPVLSVTGASHLAGAPVSVLLQDDTGTISWQTVTVGLNGSITPVAPPGPATGYTTITAGLPFTCKLQTLAIDAGSPPIQAKLKKIPWVDIRVKDTLGLTIGSDFTYQVPMKDLVIGNVSSTRIGLGSQVITDLVTGDARTILDPSYNIFGQYCIQQSAPYPATVLGVFPNLVLGDAD